MNRNYPALLSILVLALPSCKHSHQLGPLDVFELCRPGGSSDQCQRNDLRFSEAFPAGRLDALYFYPMDIELEPHLESHDGVLRYDMQFHDDTYDVEELLRKDLGAPLKDHRPPIVPSDFLFGDFYWVTPDGLWEYKRHHHVAWYSDAFHSSNPKGFIDIGEKLDQYVYPAPLSAALWKKIGLLLIGSDVEPINMRKAPGETR